MAAESPKNPAAVALGRLGGSANTPAQNKARARNVKKAAGKGGWPKGRKRKLTFNPAQFDADVAESDE